ncbi:MAG TPA: ATP-dependent DNA helicase RecG [bacterium]|nr:ATP-dependent DNA helicase RecG [bacterium]
MPPIRKQMENWLKPLRLEQKQGFGNRSVLKGLDRYILHECQELLSRGPFPWEVNKEFEGFLLGLRRQFSQYMTLQKEEREALIGESLAGIERWIGRVPKEATLTAKSENGSNLDDPLLPLVPKDKHRAFQLTGLKTVRDLLLYSPKWAVNGASLTPIAQCSNREEPYFILARINSISEQRRGPRSMVKTVLQDSSGHLSWVWFNRPYLKRDLTNGRWVLLHETPQISKWGKQVVGSNGTFEFLEPVEEEVLKSGKVLTFYPATSTLTQAFWRNLIDGVLARYGDVLPMETREGSAFGGLGFREAVLQIHHPESLEAFERARKRLAFDELLTLQTFLLLKRKAIEKRKKGRRYLFEGERVLCFRKSIPFPPTGAQKRVLKEIREDLAKPHPMNRLLQGDVGSGKTLVAAIAFLYAADSGVQSAFMAPTEILARQHFQNLESILAPTGLRTCLLTSDMKAKEKREALAAVEEGRADVAVGTHALLVDQVRFKNLGFMVIDERHKFGVMQRAALETKGKWPDCLMMTATPFPRALVLTEYGDTDLSVLDEFPQGKKNIKTFWKNEGQKSEVYVFAKERMLKGEQVFWVFPVVEESKTFLRSAVQMHQHFQKEVFHGFKIGLLHGKMKKEEKESVMAAFRNRELQMLVATTVVEVGIDIPDATMIVVEHAERFGLAQLHQLRGRVGRGGNQAYCYLVTSPIISSDAVQRMKTMVSTLDGFKLSEVDLKMRGPGEIFGVAQSGRREGGLVDLKRDVDVVEEARKKALEIADIDPGLKRSENKSLRERLESRYRGLLDLAQIS